MRPGSDLLHVLFMSTDKNCMVYQYAAYGKHTIKVEVPKSEKLHSLPAT